MEFKLPKKFHDGFNQVSIAEEENQETSPSLQNFKSHEPKSSPVKKFGRTAKKTIEPSPLSLTRVEHTKETPSSPNKPAEKTVHATVEKGLNSIKGRNK